MLSSSWNSDREAAARATVDTLLGALAQNSILDSLMEVKLDVIPSREVLTSFLTRFQRSLKRFRVIDFTHELCRA